jgi:hypothetical protein
MSDGRITRRLYLHGESFGPKGAWTVSKDGDADHAIFLPKSEVDCKGLIDSTWAGDLHEFRIPVWLARKEGLEPPRDDRTADLFSQGGQR